MTPVVGDLFRGLGRRRRQDAPVPMLDRDQLCARVGEPARPAQAAEQCRPDPSYVRVDAPRPSTPRAWRKSTGTVR